VEEGLHRMLAFSNFWVIAGIYTVSF